MKKVLFFVVLCFSFFNLFAQDDHLVVKHIEKYPIKFFENKNQWDNVIKYKADLPAGYLLLRKNSLQYSFYDAEKLASLQPVHGSSTTEQHAKINLQDNIIKSHSYLIEFVGANSTPKIIPSKAIAGKHHYYLGNDRSKWATNVETFAQITYQNLYDNIDLKLYATQSNFKYEFLLAAGIDPQVIRMNYKYAEAISLQNENLVIKTSINEVIELKPYSYQIIDGKKVEVASKFVIQDQEVYFEFPNGYNKNLPLVIDPDLIFTSYSGSTASNFGNTATYGEKGCLYATGIVMRMGFPTTTGAFGRSYNGGDWDIGVLKFDALGENLLYGAYLGGEQSEAGHSIIMNEQNELLIMGSTGSSDFPTTAGAFQTSFQGGSLTNTGTNMIFPNGSDIFITKLSSDGSRIVASTYLGGSGNDALGLGDVLVTNYGDDNRGDITVDKSGNIHIISSSASTDFPIVGTGTNFGGGTRDAVIVKMPPSLASITWSTFLGGSDSDSGISVKVAASNGDVFVAGGTSSKNFNPIIGSSHGDSDAYVARYDENGHLLASRLLGTNQYDQAYFLDLDANEDVYILGESAGSYSVSTGVYSNSGSGHFIQKMSNDLATLSLSTVIGVVNGGIDLSLTAFLVTECGDISLAGWASSTNSGLAYNSSSAGLPVTADAFRGTTSGDDFYLMVLGNNMEELIYASFFGESNGGAHVDGGISRFHKDGTVYHSICACAGGLPSTAGVYAPTSGAQCNNAVFKFAIPSIKANFEILDVSNGNSVITKSCTPAVIQLNNSSEGGETFTWHIETKGTFVGEKNPTIYTFNDVGTYDITLTVTDDRSCTTQSVHRTVFEVIDVNVSTDVTFCFEFDEEEGFRTGKTHFINPTIPDFNITANYDYVWLDSEGLVLSKQDSLEVSEQGVYVVNVFEKDSGNNCPSTDTIRVEALCKPRIFIPTGFSPNGDELNDRFVLFGKHLKSFKMEIYDRWGVVIFFLERDDFEDIKADEFWDGTIKGNPLPNGMYTWRAEYTDPTDNNPAKVNLNGQVNIVR
jgi:gliding motility-associated-like protein